MEKIIHFTVPAKLSPVHTKIIDTAKKLHPTWEVKVWRDPMQTDGYPLEKYWPKANSGAQLSDLLRLDVLYKWGGVYVDSDMRLLKALDELTERFDFFIGSYDGNVPINALIGARKAHPAIQKLIDELLLNEPDWSLPPDKTTGPDIFVRTLRWDKRATVLPRETFYSYGPEEIQTRKNHRHSYGEHLWEYSWKNLAETSGKSAIGWQSAAKRLIKPAIIAGFQFWHRFKSLDQSVSRQKIYPINDEIVLQTGHGFNIVVDGKDVNSSPAIIFGDYSEQREERFVKATLRGGDWAISVDCSGSSFCMLAAQSVRSFGRIFAYVPNQASFKQLTKSAVMNAMHDRIEIRAVAVGKTDRKTGFSEFSFTPERWADSQSRRDESSKFDEVDNADASATAPVCWVALDQEFPIDLPIKLLKIDAEGCEVPVLKGASRLLDRRCIDFVLIKVLREVADHSRWRRQLGGDRWNRLLAELSRLIESNYLICSLAEDGSLVEHETATAALDNSDSRYLILVARDQYTPGG